MLWLVGACVLVGLVVIVGAQLNRQAAAHGPRKATDHLLNIRKHVRGGGLRRPR